jgi:hypothetical protein
MKVYGIDESALYVLGKVVGVKVIVNNIVYYSEKGKNKGKLNYINFCLRPIGDNYRKISHKFGKERKVWAVCWHGHRDFMIELFRYNPNAKLTSSPLNGPSSIVYDGKEDFYNKYENTYNQEKPLNYLGTIWNTCNCND